MEYFLSVLFITCLFYLIIPGLGAFLARRQWREFRERLTAASTVPVLDFHRSRSAGGEVFQGIFKFFGSLEAIQEKNEVWLRSGNFTVTVEMKKAKIFLLPAFDYTGSPDEIYEKNRELILDEMPRALSWERFYSLSQRTDVMVCGPLFIEKGKAFFRSTGNDPVMFLIYDGKPETLLRRGVWAGRHRNEFWNIFTPASLVAGSFALFLTAYYLYSIPRLGTLTRSALALSLVPLMPLFPPGVVLFFAYRYFWKKARFLRAERDLMRLPLRYFRDKKDFVPGKCVDSGSGSRYCFRKIWDRSDAVKLCTGSDTRIRSASVREGKTGNVEYYYFYPEDERTCDPLLEKVIIEGDPRQLSSRCGKISKLYEYISIAVFSAGMAFNFFMTYVLISYLNR